jgi:hypothetical protein
LDLRFLSCEIIILDVTLGRTTEREPGKKKIKGSGRAGGSHEPLDVGDDVGEHE